MRQFVLATAGACAMVLGLAAAKTAAVPDHGGDAVVAAIEAQSASGTIRSVDLEGKSFVLTTGQGDLALGVTQHTTFKLDGKESTMRDALRAGAKATVVHEGRVASSVDVASKADLAAVEMAEGSIKSVDAEGMSFVLTTAAGDVTVRVNARTTYTLDGKESTLKDAVRVGAKARVSHEQSQATRVEVQTKA